MKRKSEVRRSVAIIGTRGYPSFYGGFETAVRVISPWLVDRGWVVDVYGRRGWIREDDEARDPRVNSRLTRGVDSRSMSTLTYGLSATLDVLRRRPAVALVMNVANGVWLPLLWLARIPTLVHVDGIEWQRAKWGPSARIVFRLGALMTKIFATSLIYDAEEIARIWKRMSGRDGWVIAYGGTPRAAVPAPLGLVKNSYVLQVARLVPENSIEEFCKAMEQLTSMPVVIVGSSGSGGDLERYVQSFSETRSNIKWLGHVHDDELLFGLWQNAGAYFHGHTVGGTNPALVQAMALGVPIVAVDTPFNREVLGDSGVLVASHPPLIAGEIEGLMKDPVRQAELASRASARAADRYTWDHICQQYEVALRDTSDRNVWLISKRRR